MYAIEFRQSNNGHLMDTDLVHVSSTKEKALEYINKNRDFSWGNLWWWAIYSIEPDTTLTFDDIEFYSIDGKLLENQP